MIQTQSSSGGRLGTGRSRLQRVVAAHPRTREGVHQASHNRALHADLRRARGFLVVSANALKSFFPPSCQASSLGFASFGLSKGIVDGEGRQGATGQRGDALLG